MNNNLTPNIDDQNQKINQTGLVEFKETFKEKTERVLREHMEVPLLETLKTYGIAAMGPVVAILLKLAVKGEDLEPFYQATVYGGISLGSLLVAYWKDDADREDARKRLHESSLTRRETEPMEYGDQQSQQNEGAQ